MSWLLKDFLPLVWEFSALILLVFTIITVLFRTDALTSHPCFFFILIIAPERLIVALTSFSETTRFILVLPRWRRTPASLFSLSSRLYDSQSRWPCFWDSALYPCSSALTSQSCYRPPLFSAELLKATRADPVEFIFVQICLLNLLLWLSPLLSTWFVTCFSLPELWATCLRSLVSQGFVFAHFSVLQIPSSLLSLLGLYFCHHFYSCWIVLNL